MARLNLLLLVCLVLSVLHAGAFIPSLVGTRHEIPSCLSCCSVYRPSQDHVAIISLQPRMSHRHAGSRLAMSSPDAAASSPPLPVEKSPPSPPKPETTVTPGRKISNEWELDVYSRPVTGADGKKLWELLICDATGSLRHVSPIPSNMVNSREVRKTIEGVIEAAPGGSKPTVIRFFRNAMFNMIDIALKEVDISVKPCRTTYAMYQWLEEREREVYPNMPGYQAAMKQPAFFDIRVRYSDLQHCGMRLLGYRFYKCHPMTPCHPLVQTTCYMYEVCSSPICTALVFKEKSERI